MDILDLIPEGLIIALFMSVLALICAVLSAAVCGAFGTVAAWTAAAIVFFGMPYFCSTEQRSPTTTPRRRHRSRGN